MFTEFRSQESEFRIQVSEFRKNLEYRDVSEFAPTSEEVSKLLEAYSRAVLDSDF